MVPGAAVAQAILADPALLEQVLKDVDVIVQAIERLHAARVALTPPAAPAAAPLTLVTPSSAPVFDMSANALENYDAEQLVALRKAHAAEPHDASTCMVCAILERRLGSATP